MSIGLQSFPELYTTLMGWHLYDQLWSLMSGTGLAYVPFIAMIIKNMAEPYESQETKSASGTSLRRMELGLLGMSLMLFFGVAPMMPLDVSKLSYTPTCQSTRYSPSHTGTTYDQAFAIPQETIRVPLWWYAVLSVSAGITAAANTTVACQPDYRQMITQVDMARIQDAKLSQQVQRFTEQCYAPAKADYLHDAHPSNDIERAKQHYGVDDTEWLGSHGFQTTYYTQLQATQPVEGFVYDAKHDLNAAANQAHPPAYGLPSCDQWWDNRGNGLRDRLAQVLPADFFTQFKDYFHNESRQDEAIKRIINNQPYQGVPGPKLPVDYGYAHLGADVGIMLSELETYPTLYAIYQAAPIVQAMLLLMVFAFLPIVLVFASYKPMAFVTGAVVIFSLMFWSYIWQLVAWTDSVLTQALYGSSWLDNSTPNAIFVNIIIAFLQVVAPLFWFGLMATLGVSAGHLVSSMTHAVSNLMNRPSTTAGSQVAGVLKKGTKI